MLKALFWDHYGDFQWSSVAAAIALIGAISSAVFSWLSYNNSVKTAEKQHQLEQKKIDADIISKSRIHWIDNTKDIASEFLVDSLRLVSLNTMLVENYSNIATWKNLEYKNYTEIKNDKIDKKRKEEAIEFEKTIETMLRDYKENIIQSNNQINELIYRTSKNNTLLLLNFGDNDENNKIINLVKDINNCLRRVTREVKDLEYIVGDEEVDWLNKIEKSYTEQTAINQKVEKLTLLLRNYYKKEWEKVKEGE
ncbi:hypothetical protein [Enterococcus mundtii]|uniref:hypothetical protein n=1 Tax=Enterococcus mundtii TaxID=53346 RepID=UPI00032E3173|nr:hypothetical protein [Enterococcus mundtii]EOH66084.1 hypothetical protein UAC_00081 [Enterococcus mundtii ATCC 882]EOU14029.1 hypothetical protein I587_02615 [Enterococcus mundtii ATCC 882]